MRARLAVLEARVQELHATLQNVPLEDRLAVEIAQEDLESVRAELARVRTQADEAVIRSPAAGRFVLDRARDLPGQFVSRGDVLAYLRDFSDNPQNIPEAEPTAISSEVHVPPDG